MNEKLKEAFDRIHADDTLKNHTKEILIQKIQGDRKSRVHEYRRLAAVFACLLFVMFGWGGYSVYFTPVYTVSVDVNPSIELGINRFDKVISVDTFNEDGYILMSSMNVRFLDYRDALEKILADEGMEQYLTQNPLITIAVCGTNEQKNDEMLANLAACTASYENVHCSSGSSEEAAGAHSAKMSCGKYKAFLELRALDPDITAEDVRDLSVQQIRDMINVLSNGMGNSTQNGNTGQEHREPDSSHGNGNGNENENGNGHENHKGH